MLEWDSNIAHYPASSTPLSVPGPVLEKLTSFQATPHSPRADTFHSFLTL